VEATTHDIICQQQETARQATPPKVHKQTATNIPLEIKELLTKERKVRTKWQRSHAPSDKMTYNRLSNNLKSKLRAMRTNSFENYASTLNRYDNSMWKPIKTTPKPVSTNPPACKLTDAKQLGAKRQRESRHICETPRRCIQNTQRRK
jgi:hypothetical protein